MKKITSFDKLLPTQEYFSYLFENQGDYLASIYNVLSIFASNYGYSKFELESPEHITLDEMSTPPAQISLMCFLIRLAQAKKILEIGTFIGNTTMHLSDAAGDDSLVTTIEYGKEFYQIAIRNFSNNGYSDRVKPLHGDAGTLLVDLMGEKFDLIFVDGSKENYLDFTLKSEKLLNRNGMILVDDAFFHGDALNHRPVTKKGLGCKNLLEHYSRREDLLVSLLPIFNGILLIAKK